ncbi:uncharacterized protein [Physcomitrium patens]|uniref:TPX2 C-terminal domain-containing protein n=1 Tax=Physcomitrium patens TaxID=3218 RepID=A0A2K1JUE6_PHYPA|nr:protein WVD2-like 4 [Physcomitrium patens]PNR45152.1 hypothetical protein PHYPA_014923 [Physcomitrium patens]|eukprot:XP_024389566.1 protein WVD2-like 4 [Physcomitrella patens]
MGQEYVTSDYYLKPVQSNDEDSNLPQFEFPVGDCGDVDISVLTVQGSKSAQVENGNGNHLSVPEHSVESPQVRGLERVHSLLDRVTARLSEDPIQREVSKHVVTEDSRPSNGVPQPPAAPVRKTLQSNPSFKSLVTLLDEPLKFKLSNTDVHKNSNGKEADRVQSVAGEGKVSATPLSRTSSRLQSIMSRVSSRTSQAEVAKTSDQPKPATSTVSVNALVEKFSNGIRSRVRDEAPQALSPNPSTGSLISPKRTLADRFTSPVPRHLLENGNSPRSPITPPKTALSPRLSSASARSVSPVAPTWKDSIYGDMPKEKRPNFANPASSTPLPRFLTPTKAATLKAVKPPVTPTSNPSKALQFTTAFGTTTPVKTESARKAPRDTPSKVDHAKCYTEPAGFKFKTDERAERRKDFYSKLEERMKLKDAEKKQQEAKAQEEKEAQLRELRKKLTYKANPVPQFYQEPAPAQPRIRKIAPTRPKSPNFTSHRRRESCPASNTSELSTGSKSPMQSARLMRCVSFENSGPMSYKSSPKAKLPFRPI